MTETISNELIDLLFVRQSRNCCIHQQLVVTIFGHQHIHHLWFNRVAQSSEAMRIREYGRWQWRKIRVQRRGDVKAFANDIVTELEFLEALFSELGVLHISCVNIEQWVLRRLFIIIHFISHFSSCFILCQYYVQYTVDWKFMLFECWICAEHNDEENVDDEKINWFGAMIRNNE